ncbi:12873_t:CDS:2 [Ambispora leptoticha]|uniref:12873_t:CDS:1 n=1 Tax=Ambispora leptoticha TaxID=144679 RepID=A0A9N8ZEZ7_9GLOM|nr:12873_t:CDS:2 [Ambispora leptoticha]
MISPLRKQIHWVLFIILILITLTTHRASAAPITPTKSANITSTSDIEVNNKSIPFYNITTNTTSDIAPDTGSTDNDNKNGDVDPEYSKKGAHWLFGISFAVMQFNAIGSIYIVYRTFRKWQAHSYARNSLSMALRVPFYIAITDLCLYIAHIFNQGYTLLNDRTWPGLSCKIVGGTVFFLVAVNMTLVGVIALSTYLRVCRRIVFDFGPFDRNLFYIVLGFPFVLTLGSIPSFGPSIYWCYTNKSNHIVSIITLILNFTVIALNIFCYYFTLREINISGKGFVNVNLNQNKTCYILMFIIQWTPAMPYVIASVVITSPPVALYLLCDIAINLGGIGNGIQYVLNEGWSLQKDDVESKHNERSFTAISPLPSARSQFKFPFNQEASIASFAAIQEE